MIPTLISKFLLFSHAFHFNLVIVTFVSDNPEVIIKYPFFYLIDFF